MTETTASARGLRAGLERRGLPPRAHGAFLLVAGLGLASLLLALAVVADAPFADRLSRAPLDLGVYAWPAAAGFALLFFALQKQGFVFHWREQSTKVSLDEIGLFLGALVLPGSHLILGVALSSTANQWLHRRDLAKGGFNVAQYATAALAAVAVAEGLARLGVVRPWHAVAAPIVFSLATSLLVSLLFSRMGEGSTWKVFHERFGSFAIVGSSLGISLGLVIYALFRLSPLAVLAAIPIFLYLRRFGRLSEWADDELKTHKLLASVSVQVAGRGDLDAVARRILDACSELFDCGEARLSLAASPDEDARSWRKTAEQGSAGVGGATVDIHDAKGARVGFISVFPKPAQSAYGEREHHLLRAVAGNAAAAASNARALQDAARANAELAASEGRYRGLFETGHLLIHVLDEDGRVLDTNPAVTATLGFRRDELLARQLDELAPADEAGRTLFEALRADGEVRGTEVRLRTRDGGAVCVLLDAKALDAASGERRYVVFSRDITTLKALEAELRDSMDQQRETIKRLENMNRELEEFTLWTTHDMREPLRSIGTIATFLHEDIGTIDAEEARDMARRISEGAERLKERVKALHAFSRIVQRDDAFDDVDLQRVVEHVVASLDAKVQEKRAVIRLPAKPFPTVRAQPHRIDQVFANLVENALKYGHAAAPQVEVGFEEAPGEWRFWVRDNGPGVPPGYHERIFLLFQRGPETSEPGSGAGLAIVKRIAEQHGGRAWVESRQGEGARFCFSLPSQRPRAAPSVRIAPQAAGPPRKPF